MIYIFVIFSLIIIFATLYFVLKEHLKKPKLYFVGIVVVLLLVTFCFSLALVNTSRVGIVKTFGKVSPVTISEGVSFVLPWQSYSTVYVGMDALTTSKAQAASKDLQVVHAELLTNFHVSPSMARELYQQIPSLNYKEDFVNPAIYEMFKSVVAKYTAEELIEKRSEVSESITRSLNEKLKQYHISVQSVNLINFGFSKSFDEAIEEKVTALQRAATAENDLKRKMFEAEQRIVQAKGEAEAIKIQAQAIANAGGADYVQLQAIGKWDGKMPQYVTGGQSLPMIGVK